MLRVGDTVKVLCTTEYNGKPTKFIPIGTICMVINVDTKNNSVEIIPENMLNVYNTGYWYKEDELEKGHLEWVKG